jgi:CBS domain containing-hemolysin-like protein
MGTFPIIGICAVLGVVAALSLSLRDVSFSRLGKHLSAKGRADWLDRYRESQQAFILSSATMRMLWTLALVLAVADVMHSPQTATESTGIQMDVVWTFLLSGALILVFGITVPQAVARYVGEQLLASRIAMPLVSGIHLSMWPLTHFQLGVTLVVRRLAGVPETNGHADTEQIEQEVMEAVEEAELHGAVDETEREMIKSVMELDEATAEQIMTPRTDIIGAEKTTGLAELKELIKKEGHSRIPVYDDTIDQVLGLVYAKDLLHVDDDEGFSLENHLREVSFVPQTKSVRDLLTEFRSGKTHVAVVLDEYGGTAGLVTIEDILEELVGEIQDEFEPPEPEPIVHIDDRVVEVDSKVHVDEINELLDLKLPEEEDYETIGGYVFSTMGKIPTEGEVLTAEQCRITILEAEDRRIKRLRIEATANNGEA